MNWEDKARYRGRGVAGEIAIKLNEKTGTRYVEALIEVTVGPLLTERIRWRGYLNSERNVEVAVSELRAMGWRGQRLGDWSGFGSKEVQFTCMVDVGEDDKRYPRAAFVQEPQTIKRANVVDSADLDALNAQFAGVIKGAAPASSSPAAPTARDPYDDARRAPDEPNGASPTAPTVAEPGDESAEIPF